MEKNKFKTVTIGASVILKRFLDAAGAKISLGTVVDAIAQTKNETPVFSMLEMKRILTQFGFETYAAKIQPEALHDLSFPVLSHTKEEDDEEFILITDFTHGNVHYFQPGSLEKTEPFDHFLRKWNGVVLDASSENDITEQDYVSKQEHDKARVSAYIRMKMKIVDDFLTTDECNTLIRSAEGLFQRSLVSADGKEHMVSSRRTSSSAFLHSLDLSFKGHVIQKAIVALNGRSFSDFEDLQCVAYNVGQEFKAHFDSGPGMPRQYTILVYLNDNFSGGETYFPMLNHAITPRQGRAILFHNLDDRGELDLNSFHAGLPVSEGTKFACNIWIR